MRTQRLLTIAALIALASYFGYWAIQFIGINPVGYEAIACSVITIVAIPAIVEQVRNLKTRKS